MPARVIVGFELRFGLLRCDASKMCIGKFVKAQRWDGAYFGRRSCVSLRKTRNVLPSRSAAAVIIFCIEYTCIEIDTESYERVA